MTARKAQTATTSAPRQTQRGVAKASAARKAVDSNAAKVTNINDARKAVEQTITDVLLGKTTTKQAEKQLDAAVKSTTARKRAPRKTLVMTDKGTTLVVEPATPVGKRAAKVSASYAADLAAAQKSEAVKATTPRKRIAAEKSTTKKMDLATNGTAMRVHEIEIALKAPENADIRKQLIAERDPMILQLIKSGAGYSEIARVRGVPASTNRGLCRVLEGGKRI
jgi:hypothetical protein